MGDKRIYELTQISSAPANGVLPIDVPGSEETNGITVENLARTMPVVTSERNGIMSSDILNSLFSANRIVGSEKNANDLMYGVYVIYSGTSENNYPAEYGTIVSFRTGPVTNFQLFIPANSNDLYVRSLWETWTQWRLL